MENAAQPVHEQRLGPSIQEIMDEVHRNIVIDQREYIVTDVDRANRTVTVNFADMERRYSANWMGEDLHVELRATPERERLQSELRDLQRRRDYQRGRRFGRGTDMAIERDIHRLQTRLRQLDAEQEHERRQAESRAHRSREPRQRVEYQPFSPNWVRDMERRMEEVSRHQTLQEEVRRVHEQRFAGLSEYLSGGTRTERVSATNSQTRRTWARGPERQNDMEENGHRVHLTTRDGYRKTVRIPGTIGEVVSLPETDPGTNHVLAEGESPRQASVRRRDFRVLRRAVYTDMVTGAEAHEYWATER